MNCSEKSIKEEANDKHEVIFLVHDFNNSKNEIKYSVICEK